MAEITVRHDAATDTVLFQVSGVFEVKDGIEASDAFYAEHLVRHSIWDLREITVENADLQSMREAYGSSLRQTDRMPGGRRAAIIVNSQLHSILARLYKVVTEERNSPTDYQIFTDLDQAFTWLGYANPFSDAA